MDLQKFLLNIYCSKKKGMVMKIDFSFHCILYWINSIIIVNFNFLLTLLPTNIEIVNNQSITAPNILKIKLLCDKKV